MTFAATYQEWRPELIEALDARYYTPAWLDYIVMEGRAALLATEDAAAIVEVRYFPTGAKDLHVIAGAGSPAALCGEILTLLLKMRDDNGCIAIAVESREAWARLLKGHDFNLYKTILRREL